MILFVILCVVIFTLVYIMCRTEAGSVIFSAVVGLGTGVSVAGMLVLVISALSSETTVHKVTDVTQFAGTVLVTTEDGEYAVSGKLVSMGDETVLTVSRPRDSWFTLPNVGEESYSLQLNIKDIE